MPNLNFSTSTTFEASPGLYVDDDHVDSEDEKDIDGDDDDDENTTL